MNTASHSVASLGPAAKEWSEASDLPPIVQSVRPYSMVPHAALVDLARQTRVVLEQGIPGALVECGAWRGGASFLMALILKHAGVRDRKVWMFDSFEGIQPPEEIDGPAAKAWARNTDGPMYFDNLRAPVDEVRKAATDLGVSEIVDAVKGWFDKTLPAARDRIGPIAILRIDADWHSSVKCCLENLYDQVVDGGFIIFDDYYTWDGCAVAVHEFLGSRGLCHRIETTGGVDPACAVFRKGKTTWSWARGLHLVGQDLASLTRTHDRPIILVDDDTLRSQLPSNFPLLPFTERNGLYSGPPADDKIAIDELNRMQALGAAVIAFTWPSFWWLEHYSQFAAHLSRHSGRVIDNDRLVAFHFPPDRRR
jgi:O-methyltransferase